MFGEINATFHHRVLAAYERYRDERDSCRTGSDKLLQVALDLAVAIHHFPEHLPAELNPSNERNRVPELKFVSEAANAAKHHERKFGVQKYLKRADALTEVAFSTEYLDDTGTYKDCAVRVMAACLDGTERDLDAALVAALNFWIAYLAKHGVTKPLELKPAHRPGTAYVERASAQSLSIVVNQQTDAKLHLRCQRFNPVTLSPEAIDMTGCDASFRVYPAPSMELAVKLSHPRFREDLEASIQLTAQEVSDLEAASLLGLRDAMMEQLVVVHKPELEQQLQVALSALDKNTTRT